MLKLPDRISNPCILPGRLAQRQVQFPDWSRRRRKTEEPHPFRAIPFQASILVPVPARGGAPSMAWWMASCNLTI